MLILIKNTIGAIRGLIGIVTDGLKMFLPFSSSILNANGQFSLDSTSNNNDAKLFTGNALSFDGVNDYVDFGSDINSNGNVWTVAFWISDYTAGTYSWIIGDNTTKNIGLRNNISSSHKVFYREDGGAYYDFNYNGFENSFTAAIRFVMASDGTDIKLYINGEFKDSITPTSSTNLKISRFMAGYNTTQFLVNATTSDFQLWDTSWTQSDVTYDYNKPNHLITDNQSTSIALSNLKGWFALTEGSGNLAIDSATELGSDLVTNGDFASDSNWIKGTGWTISGGSANGSSTTGDLYQENVVESGKYYQVTFTISNYSAGSVRVELPNNSSAGTDRSANGTYTEIILSSGTIVLFDARTSFTGSIDNVSVKEVSVGTINGATHDDAQSTILQLGMINWSNGSGVFLPSSPTNSSQDILGNAVRERLNSLNLTGTGYAEVDDANSFDFGTSDFSYGFWFKVESGNTGFLFGVSTLGNSSGVGLTMDLSNGKIRSRPFGVTEVYTTSGYNDGNWHFAFHNIDRSDSAKLFIDNTEVLSQDISSQSSTSLATTDWYVGVENGASTFLNGLIDNITIYNRVLSSNELEQNYKAGLSAHQN